VEVSTGEPRLERTNIDLSKLAKAVARHETGNCTAGYGKLYNNCHGIKSGRTAPCPRVGKNNMCIYSNPSQSYEAFKKIWPKVYGDRLPTLADAQTYSGRDKARAWLKNVTTFYYAQ